MANQKVEKGKLTRRNFFKGSTLVMIGGAIAYGAASVPALRSEELLLRPPGALEEDLFLASCIKCGQCLQVCPPQIIMLAKIDQGFGLGTPYIVPREGACILCKGLPCVLACPTGSLNHDISEGSEAEMGLAVISKPETCLSIKGKDDLVYELENLRDSKQSMEPEKLSTILTRLINKLTSDELEQWKQKWQLEEISVQTISQVLAKLDKEHISWLVDFTTGTQQAAEACKICLETCPIKEENPIVFETRKDAQSGKEYVIPVVQKTCVGCGVCEMECPTPEPSITIVPRLKWKEETA